MLTLKMCIPVSKGIAVSDIVDVYGALYEVQKIASLWVYSDKVDVTLILEPYNSNDDPERTGVQHVVR